MTYADYEYYTETFKGTPVPLEDFDRLNVVASDIIDLIVCNKITDVNNNIKTAACYQIELLSRQGGVEAITGFADSSTAIKESLGDYSVGSTNFNEKGNASWNILHVNDIPVSRLTVKYLKDEGLMSRWLYAESQIT